MISKLHKRLAATTRENIISVMTNLIDQGFDEENDMGPYVSEFQRMFSKLFVIGSPTVNDMQMNFLLISV